MGRFNTSGTSNIIRVWNATWELGEDFLGNVPSLFSPEGLSLEMPFSALEMIWIAKFRKRLIAATLDVVSKIYS